MKRTVMTLKQIIDWVTDGCGPEPEEQRRGILYWIEPDDMGWCKDGVTRWYTFDGPDDKPCIYFKH